MAGQPHTEARAGPTICHCLREGGAWINYGPLLYHFAETHGEVSVEVCLEDLYRIVERCGFRLQHRELRQSHYTGNERSMLQVVYTNAFFVAVKATPSSASPSSPGTT
eukprot:GGOE01020655.1.p2 GENE.GGOE01020655.1~~GGOE01020655.1.p2  ORF type:complete len:108 (+),score=27.58 GGOE01020655.1:181-504(+)